MIYESRNRREADNLHPAARHKVFQLIDRCELVGLNFLIVSGSRTNDDQNEKWKQGREYPGPIVTYVKGGDSKHNYGVAIDFVPVLLGFLKWNSKKQFEQIARIAVEIGFEWPYQKWNWDIGHLEYSPDLDIAALKAGKRPDATKARDDRVDDLQARLRKAQEALESGAVTFRRKSKLRRFVRMMERQLEQVQ